MKCQILFSGKNKEDIINLSSPDFAQRVVKVMGIGYTWVHFLSLFVKRTTYVTSSLLSCIPVTSEKWSTFLSFQSRPLFLREAKQY